ncbi:hypothetical protein GW575_09600, partial [Campylobacter sp. MIT 19-121]|nr:hypothetical protein [Campylobacter sp. MIT 19-121]
MHKLTAKERIKNTLSYKIGLELINTDKTLKEKNTLVKFTLGGGAYLSLLYKLYHIKQQHYKELKLYKQISKIFPELQRAKLESLSDYHEAVICQFHLAYLLGQAFIKADKTWYKGGYLKLFEYIKEAKLIHKNFLHLKDTIQ